jgi:hypothetical protein
LCRHPGRGGENDTNPLEVQLACNRRTRCFAYIGISSMRSVQHICIEANRLDDVGRAYDLVQERNLPITLSLGRHTMDTLPSFCLRSPSGFDIGRDARLPVLWPACVASLDPRRQTGAPTAAMCRDLFSRRS